MKRYSAEHQWIEQDGDEAVVGISTYAQESLGDLCYVELPKIGAAFKGGEAFCVVESTKAASDVFMPVGGTIVAVNTALETDLSAINEDPEGAGWICRIRVDDAAEFEKLMDAAAYADMEK